MDEGSEAVIGLVVARGDPAPFLEPLDAILDRVPLLVHFGVVRDGLLAVGL